MKQNINSHKLSGVLSHFILWSHLDYLYRRFSVKDKITHVFYHDVVEESPLPETKLFVEEKYFWEHMKEIGEKYNIIGMSDLIEGKSLPKYPLVLSFDGYSSGYVYLAERLSDRNIKALFYLQTEPILTGRPHWHQQLYLIVRTLRNLRIEIKIGNKVYYHEFTNNPKENIYKSGRLFKFIEDSGRERQIVDHLAEQYGINIKEFDRKYRPLSETEVGTLSAFRGVELGSHSHTHANFKNLNNRQIFDELRLSKGLLEKWSQKKVIHFCYPEGYTSKPIIEMVKEAGYVTASTTRRSLHDPNLFSHERYLIPRFCAPNGHFHFLSDDLLGLRRFYH